MRRVSHGNKKLYVCLGIFAGLYEKGSLQRNFS